MEHSMSGISLSYIPTSLACRASPRIVQFSYFHPPKLRTHTFLTSGYFSLPYLLLFINALTLSHAFCLPPVHRHKYYPTDPFLLHPAHRIRSSAPQIVSLSCLHPQIPTRSWDLYTTQKFYRPIFCHSWSQWSRFVHVQSYEY